MVTSTTSRLLRFTFALAITFAGAFASLADEQTAAAAAGQGIVAPAAGQIPSPNMRSIPRRASSLTRRPLARCASSINPASKARRCSTLPMSLKDGDAKRPLTFVFNGGPGAASAFLHLGLVGPRILDLGPDARDFARAQLRDNPDTWLRFTDLVLIDPIGTGWSRAAKADDGKSFWNAEGDASSMAKAIALYVDHNNRFNSPKYLFGESYGGFRAAKTARAMQREQGISASGIVMLSPLIEGWLTFGDDSSALRSALELPSLAAAELERKKAFTPQALAAAEKFAMTDYLTTLAGPTPQGDAARAFYERVAQVSGLPLDLGQAAARLRDQCLHEEPAGGQDRQSLRRDLRRRRPVPRAALRPRARSDPRRRVARLWRRLCRLRAQRARLQDRCDLSIAGGRRHSPMGLERRARRAPGSKAICACC